MTPEIAIGQTRVDRAYGARVVARTPLLYRDGAHPALDRPAHVRAGSALAWWNGMLAVIQDDASFLALVDPTSGLARDIPFPSDGVRQFDETRGNKSLKLDLEAAFVTPDGATLVALGSGSSPKRERIVLVSGPDEATPRVTIVHAAEVYAALRADRFFSGSELNIEGAALTGDDVVLFQRGNGAPLAEGGTIRTPVDATCRIALLPLLAYLEGAAAAPALRSVLQWRLGSIDGITVGPSNRLTFTDGAMAPNGNVAFLACAEDSPDATRDGPVSAVAIGILDDTGRTCTLGPIIDERGAPLLDKAEGLAFDPTDRTRAFVVTDRDDPTAPSELLELRLGSGW